MKALLTLFQKLPNVRVRFYLTKKQLTQSSLKGNYTPKKFLRIFRLRQLFQSNPFHSVQPPHRGDRKTRKWWGLFSPVRKNNEYLSEFDPESFREAQGNPCNWDSGYYAEM